MDAYVVAVEGLSSLDDVASLSGKIARYAQMAINRTARDERSAAAKEMRAQINFPARYISGASGRLTVSKQATAGSLEAAITGRDRPTSLARFATSRSVSASRRRGGVTVQVGAGSTKTMQGAFLINLRNNNLGLAIRLKPGETVRNKRNVRPIGKGLYLLYGPSVNQVFRGVAEDRTPEAAQRLEAEFLRLLEL